MVDATKVHIPHACSMLIDTRAAAAAAVRSSCTCTDDDIALIVVSVDT